MCCLFGIINYGSPLHPKKIDQILRKLSVCAEQRGTDATGIAYVCDGKIAICKKPLPAHRLHFNIPKTARIIMGHTRLTTQGNARKNYNNHPFRGAVGNTSFAFAHNGTLYNDTALRKKLQLPQTQIETDSYIGVQLLESQKTLSFQSLKYMAEKVSGAFTFTLLDNKNNVYFVKGDNPLALYHFPDMGLYLYASTKEILEKAISSLDFRLTKAHVVGIDGGGLLRIDAEGNITRGEFEFAEDCDFFWYQRKWENSRNYAKQDAEYSTFVADLKLVCRAYGWEPHQIDMLIAEGFTTDEIEAALYGEYC